jgi:predicted transposase/invertase (TIGR01784 family)
MPDKLPNRPFNNSYVNDIYENAVLKINELEAMSYESEYARAMALKPHRDLINSLDTARKEEIKKGISIGIEQGKLLVQLKTAEVMLAEGFDIKTIAKVTGLTEEVILQQKVNCDKF